MIPSISIFQRALSAPEFYLSTLKVIKAVGDEPFNILRTYGFAEAEVLLNDNSRALLFMPLSDSHAWSAKRIALCLKDIDSPIILPYIYLEREIVTIDDFGNNIAIDLILQPIPKGEPLSYTMLDNQSILPLLDNLEQHLRQLGISHNNLTPHNIIVGEDNRLYPIRYHYLTTDGAYDDFQSLRNKFSPVTALSDTISTYDATTEQEPFIPELHNNLICFCSRKRYGYRNREGEIIIKPQYIAADHFCEDRAVVDTADGCGVIDTAGNYIIKPVFNTIRYDKARTLFFARYDNVTSVFDYNGYKIEDTDHPQPTTLYPVKLKRKR